MVDCRTMTAMKFKRGADVEIALDMRHAATSNALSPSNQNLFQPPQDEVARLAFEIYRTRPDYPGRDWEDWFEAESILMLEAHVAQLSHAVPMTKADPKLTASQACPARTENALG